MLGIRYGGLLFTHMPRSTDRLINTLLMYIVHSGGLTTCELSLSYMSALTNRSV